MKIATSAMAAGLLSVLFSSPAIARDWIVCAADAKARDCSFKGNEGIPQAIEKAASGDTIRIRAGRYLPTSTRDLGYRDLTLRAYALIDRKDLTLIGEPGAVLDGSGGRPAAAIVINKAKVTIRDLEISGHRYEIEEDKVYDGHGIFAVDSQVQIDKVTISRFQKMGLSGRGDSQLDVSNLKVLDGHVGIWLKEMSYLRMRDSLLRGNDSSAVTVYDHSAAQISNTVVDSNHRYGLYANQQGALFASNSMILGNQLGGLYAVGESRIVLDYSALHGNKQPTISKDHGKVLLGTDVIEADPLLGPDYRPRPGSPLLGKGNPTLGTQIGPRS